MKKIEVFDGNDLHRLPPQGYLTGTPKCAFIGTSDNGADIQVPIDENLLSRHMMLLGGIGTGKTNTFNQLIRQLKFSMTQDDVMIIFDTKGDFYKEFYQPGDIVISNDGTATGPDGPDYWNIFNEIERDDHMEDNIVEITKALFHERLEKSSQPFFPTAAKDLLSGILTHICRNPNIRATNKSLKDFLDSAPSSQIATA